MSRDSEAIEAIEALARRSYEPKPVPTQDSRKLAHVINGSVHETDVPPPDRRHLVRTVEALVEAARKWGEGGVLWHDASGCSLVCDDADRRDIVHLPLPCSVALATLQQVVGRGAIPHREFVRLLRHDLSDCIPAGLATALSAIEVHSEQRKRSEATASRERGMAEFRRELANAVDVPEATVATFPVYDVPDLRDCLQSAELSIDIDLEASTCRLIPRPSSIARAVEATQLEIARRLGDAGVPVFWGAPTAK